MFCLYMHPALRWFHSSSSLLTAIIKVQNVWWWCRDGFILLLLYSLICTFFFVYKNLKGGSRGSLNATHFPGKALFSLFLSDLPPSMSQEPNSGFDLSISAWSLDVVSLQIAKGALDEWFSFVLFTCGPNACLPVLLLLSPLDNIVPELLDGKSFSFGSCW